MKIEVTSYVTDVISKKDIRLTIGFTVSNGATIVIRSSVVVQLHPIAYFHGKVQEEAFGLLILASIIYGIDRSIKRHKYSVDGWSREFDVEIKLPSYEKFQENKLAIDQMLSFLTGDYWNCNFVGGVKINYPTYTVHSKYDNITQVNLFSGGLDSLIGAVDYLACNPNGKLYLSSHYDSYMTGPRKDQTNVRNELKKKYSKSIIYRDGVCITPSDSNETSCRSRSLIFIALANIVATYAKCDVVVPENGSVSLNFPLSPSRRAACSTRTTHPVFLSQLQSLIYNLGISTKVFNPYEFKTKGEMVNECADLDALKRILPVSNSCGKRNMHQHMYDDSYATHCSHCMPCMYRRASTISINDSTRYGNRLETIFMRKSDTVSNDFYAMLDFLKRDLSPQAIKKELHIAGMSGFRDLDDYVDLVIRTRVELSAMIKKENSTLINKYMGWI